MRSLSADKVATKQGNLKLQLLKIKASQQSSAKCLILIYEIKLRRIFYGKFDC